MKIEDLKAGRVYRAKRPRVVHTLGGSYINDRQILSISPYKNAIRFRKNGQWIDNLGYQGGIFSGYRLKNPHKKPLAETQVKV